MKDDFDAVVRAWMRDAARPDPTSLAAVHLAIDRLPARRRRSRGFLAAAAVLAVLAIGTVGILVNPNSSGGPSHAVVPTPPNPAAFAGDARVAACFGAAGPVEFAFELPHARDYQRHFPAMLLAPELDVDAPGFAVVFAAGAPLLVGGSGPSATPSTGTSPDPNLRSVCILVGGVPNLYEDVDITGMTVHLDGASATPGASASASATVASTPNASGGAFETPGPYGRTWFDASGAIVPPSTLLERQGPGHCGWETTTWLGLIDTVFIRDPDGILQTQTLGAYEPDATLPPDAVSTGYTLGGRTIWQGSDPEAIYVVSADHVERWPALVPGTGCA
jgi:hypothetical protein